MRYIFILWRKYELKLLYLTTRIGLSIVDKLFVPKIRYPFYLRPIRSDILTFHQTFTLKEYDIEVDIDPAFIIDAELVVLKI